MAGDEVPLATLIEMDALVSAIINSCEQGTYEDGRSELALSLSLSFSFSFLSFRSLYTDAAFFAATIIIH